MNENPLILTPLEKALNSLALALEQPKDEFIRDAVIQRFEYSYELSWKMLQRQLVNEVGKSEIDILTRKDVFRLGAKKKLIESPENWFIYYRARNETSLVYNQDKAEEVYGIAKRFYLDAVNLLNQLQTRNEKN